jgi:HPt (histidine-containing phosphotransfer) domain-containing protein
MSSVVESRDNLERKLTALRAGFAEKLSGRLAEIEAAVGALGADPQAPGWRAKLRVVLGLAHQLAGSAGTFGFTALGEAARDVEGLCAQALEASDEPGDAVRAAIVRRVAGLRAHAVPNAPSS